MDVSARAAMRVVHVAAHYPPFLGGQEKVVESLALDQRKRGFDVAVLTSRDGQAEIAAANEADFVSRFRSWSIANTAIIPGLARELLRQPRRSIIHLHVAQAFVPEAVFAAHLLRGLPYVAHLHIDVGPSSWAGFLLRAWKPLVLGPILRRASLVVVFTDEQRSATSAKYRLGPERIVVIPNGVDPSFFCDDRRSLHAKPRLLFVGRLAVQKNLVLLLRALDGVSDRFDTTLVGDGELEGELRKTVRDLHLQNVRFHGRAGGAELLALYRDSDVFVLPSEREGMPLVLLEAMAMGLPVVATDVPGNRDLVQHDENGMLVPPDDPAALRSALMKITRDGAQYSRMSAMARRYADRYSWDVVSAEFARLYEKVSGPEEP